ncbi:MAG TPA: hypothetical protein VL966_19935 [Alphaproteobacteria bacterium]|jgi:hypothetical protein|nr:hypothetical protein [Alphaproteobacteria bacterium]
MAEVVDRAAFWAEFICERCRFPDPERLRAQFAVARFSDFCDCGCNSFAVSVPSEANVPRIAAKSQRDPGMVFEAYFTLPDEKTLEIILFADRSGNLSYVEIDCCANAYPVPEEIEADDAPFHVYVSAALIR